MLSSTVDLMIDVSLYLNETDPRVFLKMMHILYNHRLAFFFGKTGLHVLCLFTHYKCYA